MKRSGFKKKWPKRTLNSKSTKKKWPKKVPTNNKLKPTKKLKPTI